MITYGPKPEFRELPVERLHVDDRYQRNTQSARSQRTIRRMVADFKWLKFGVVLAMPWPEKDGWAILDGQHRTEAARELAITAVPALVYPEMSPASAAEIFVDVNVNRVQVHPMALHYARLAAEDPEAVEIDEICARTGIIIARYPKMPDRMVAGETMAISTIRSSLKQCGPEALEHALAVLRRAFKDAPGAIRSNLIKAVTGAFTTATPGQRDAVEAFLGGHSGDQIDDLVNNRRLPGVSRCLVFQSIIDDVKAGRDPKSYKPPTVAESVREAVEPDTGKKWESPKFRRCEGCEAVFSAIYVRDTHCEQCTARMEGRAA